MDLKKIIRDFPDFPKSGILFRDISPVLASPDALHYVTKTFGEQFKEKEIDLIAGVEARGLAFAALLAVHYDKGFIMVRKKGKLPGPTINMSYGLEYGEDVMEIQEDAIKQGQNVLIVDDLLATGGTAVAAAKLVTKAGANVCGLGFVIELTELNGRDVLNDYHVETLVSY